MTQDPKLLAQQRFDRRAGDRTDARTIIYESSDVPIIIGTLLDAVQPVAVPGARIIELGFGPADFFESLQARFSDCRLYGLDLSLPYVRAARTRFGSQPGLLAGDMERLPFADASFDAVVTCWTLYFMRDLDAALAEFRRILRPGGVFLTATNARDHMQEYTALARRAVREVLDRELPPDIDARFDIDTGGETIRRHFPNAELREWTGVLRITSAEDGLALWDTYGDWSVHTDERPTVLAALRQFASEHLQREGVINVRRHGGAFVATR